MALDILACASLTGICETNLSVSELMTSVKVKVVDNNLVIALIRTWFTRLVLHPDDDKLDFNNLLSK